MDIIKGAFIVNRYYTDGGTEYAYGSLARAFGNLSQNIGCDISLTRSMPLAAYDRQVDFKNCGDIADADFAVFWDKDIFVATALEKSGIRVFNSSTTIAVCDDKQKTYAALTNIDIPKTISAPLVYDVNRPDDREFLDFVSATLGYPIVVKENTGSQGRQVHLAHDFAQLLAHYQRLKHIPHHYQRLTGEFGGDIRIYTVGGKAVAACRRQGTDFKSNLAGGGSVSLVNPSAAYITAAEDIATQLGLSFGAVDFLITDTPVFLEVNSNAYFRGIEGLGVDIAGRLAAYIALEMLNQKPDRFSGAQAAKIKEFYQQSLSNSLSKNLKGDTK